MEFKTDIFLKHSCWEKAEFIKNQLGFFNRMIYIFIVAASIGIAKDQTVENENVDEKTIGRNTLQINQDINSLITFLYQNAMLNSKKIDLPMNERKKIAFNHDNVDSKYNPSIFLVGYANYGMIQLANCITDHDIESIQNIVDLIKTYKENAIISDEELDNLDLEESE